MVLAAVTGIGGVLRSRRSPVSGWDPAPAASNARGRRPRRHRSRRRQRASRRAPCRHPSPTAKPKPSPTAAPPWKATWSKPRLVDKESCGEFAVGIDARSRYHVVTSCGLRYSVTNGDGSGRPPRWATRRRSGTPDRDRRQPGVCRVLARPPVRPRHLRRERRLAPSAGVYYRRRTLPDGAWSKAIPFGKRGDHLQAFRVDGGVLHAIVWNGTSGHRVHPIDTGPGGQHPARDRRGRRRVAAGRGRWTGARRLLGRRFAPLRDLRRVRLLDLEGRERPDRWSGHARSSVRATNPTSSTRSSADGGLRRRGCRLSREGTYYATLVNGKWTSQRITKKLGLPSIALDPETGRVHVLVDNMLYTKEPPGLGLGTAARGGRQPGDAARPSDREPSRRLSSTRTPTARPTACSPSRVADCGSSNRSGFVVLAFAVTPRLLTLIDRRSSN